VYVPITAAPVSMMLPLAEAPPALRIACAASSQARATNATSWFLVVRAGVGAVTVMVASVAMVRAFQDWEISGFKIFRAENKNRFGDI
jgi:hypothetical protein